MYIECLLQCAVKMPYTHAYHPVMHEFIELSQLLTLCY